jgi:metal-responsive CopG/Arc/MetJ family transcriptional regulator
MKIAVSIPEPVFTQAETLAKLMNVSRSKIYTRALGEFIANHADSEVTAAMNAAIEAVGCESADQFTREAGRRVFETVEW